MLLEGKKILIMGIRNKWSIAFGIAKAAYENGAKLIFTYMGEDNKPKIEELISEFEGSKAYVLNGASEDEIVRETFEKIKDENGKVDGIVHAIAHANTEDLRNDLDEVYDLERLAGRISYGNLNARDMLQLKRSLSSVPKIKKVLEEIHYDKELETLDELVEILERSINEDPPLTLKEGSIIKDSYNEELDELEKEVGGPKILY